MLNRCNFIALGLIPLFACGGPKTVVTTSCKTAAECPVAQPNCDGQVCFACASNDQCPSKLCLSGGLCADETAVVYVDSIEGTCMGTHEGTRTDPVCQIDDGLKKAIASGKKLVKVAGISTRAPAYQPLTLATSEKIAILIAGPGHTTDVQARIANSGKTGLSVTANDGGAIELVLRGLTFLGASEQAALCGVVKTGTAKLAFDDVSITSGVKNGIESVACDVRVTNSDIQNNGGNGIDLKDANLTVEQSRIYKNGVAGLRVNGGSAQILRSTIYQNSELGADVTGKTITVDQSLFYLNGVGGIKLQGTTGTFRVQNSMIYRNGGPAASLETDTPVEFTFNTVADNGSSGQVGGIRCGTSAAKATGIQNSIVVGNTQLTSSKSQFSGECRFESTVVGSFDMGNLLGTVIKLDPIFVQSTSVTLAYDYRLRAGDGKNRDCCIDKVTPGGMAQLPTVDIDNSPRPRGTAWDIGAFEVP